MTKKIFIILGIVVGLALMAMPVMRMVTKRHSPERILEYSKNGLDFSITYCSPSKKDRIIFGGLVPFGEVWRTGANEATEITLKKDALVGGELLKAGTYTFFTIPQPEEWTFIFNSVLEQWGAFTYDQTKDVLRVTLPSGTIANEAELFEMTLEQVEDNTVLLVLHWDKTISKLPIKAVN